MQNCSVQTLKARLGQGIVGTCNKEFDLDQQVVYPLIQGTNTYWHSIRVSLLGFVYCQGDEADPDDLDDGDEPEFVIPWDVDRQKKAVDRYPHTKDVPTVLPFQNVYPRLTTLVYNGLADGDDHEIHRKVFQGLVGRSSVLGPDELQGTDTAPLPLHFLYDRLGQEDHALLLGGLLFVAVALHLVLTPAID